MKFNYSNLQGPLGFWKYPFLNKLRSRMYTARYYSIKDHKVLSGQPEYISKMEIEVAGDSKPWTIKMAYDTVIQVHVYDLYLNQDWKLQPVKWPKDYVVEMSQPYIDFLRSDNKVFVYEQIDPVGSKY